MNIHAPGSGISFWTTKIRNGYIKYGYNKKNLKSQTQQNKQKPNNKKNNTDHQSIKIHPWKQCGAVATFYSIL